jgi:spore maturation protein CgeB
MLDPARRWPEGRFAVVGPMYPEGLEWPDNVMREIHLSPREHPSFYGAQRFTLNVTRAAMKEAGHSPSVRLFEAGACAVPVISDWWEGLEALFVPGREILVARDGDDTLRILWEIGDVERKAIGEAARRRILAEHTPEHRAAQLLGYWKEVHDKISAHPARPDGRRRESDHGLAAGVASEPGGTRAGERTGGDSGQRPASGDLHQPAGARR